MSPQDEYAENESSRIRSWDEAAPSDFQRPSLTVDDPRGGFKNNPEFHIMGSFDNGGCWSSTSGNYRSRFYG